MRDRTNLVSSVDKHVPPASSPLKEEFAVVRGHEARSWKKAFMLNAFPPKKLSVREKFTLLRSAGFAGVEPNSHLDRKEVMQAKNDTGLEIASISCGEHSRLLGENSAVRRQQGLDGLLHALDSAKEYGASSILVVAGGVNENVSYADNWKRTQEQIAKAVPLAEKLGVVMAIENVWNNFLLSPLEAVRYIEQFRSSAVGWHFDIGNVMSIGWPEHWIRVLGKHIQKIHIKEFSPKKMNEQGLRKGFAVEYREGENNWASIMTALDEVGYKGWAIAEPACGPCKQTSEVGEYLKRVSADMDRILAST